MDRKHLEYLLAVAAHGSFTSAAYALHIAQPSLSYAVRALERELGVELFHRLGRGVTLTPAGEAAAVAEMVHAGQCELGLADFSVPTTGLNMLELPEQEILAVLPPGTELPAGARISSAA